jgi:hypothetical protein
MTTQDGGIIDREKPGRTRTHFSKADDRELLLQAAYREIAEAGPQRLKDIVARVQAVRRAAMLSGGKTSKRIAADALEIETRAKRRLNALERQAQN